jgi:hypothetical protein
MTLRLYGEEQELPTLDWAWARAKLENATIYWFGTARPGNAPTVRPCWGAWVAERLLLSVGSHIHAANLRVEPNVSVHLSSAREVVIVEGTATYDSDPALLAEFVEAYNPKYGWDFTAETTGPVVTVRPDVVMGWTSRGAAGRAGFAAVGRWEPNLR